MGVVFEAGYTPPSGDEPLTHARILHANNWMPVRQITLTNSDTGDDGWASENSLTYEKMTQKDDKTGEDDLSNFASPGVTISADGETITEETSTSSHWVNFDGVTLPSSSGMFVDIEYTRGMRNLIQLQLFNNDTASLEYAGEFNLQEMTAVVSSTAGAEAASSVERYIRKISPTRWRLMVQGTHGGGAITDAEMRVFLLDEDINSSYTGDGVSNIRIVNFGLHETAFNIEYRSPAPFECDCCLIAAHNLGDMAATVVVQHDSDDDGTFTSIVSSANIADNEPLLFIFDPVTSQSWKLLFQDMRSGDEVGVVKFGKLMQMERPIYGGHSPLDLSRQTIVRSNYSETGEFLGKTTQRSFEQTSFGWSHLTASWVRANWPSFQRAAESEAYAIAWRPETFDTVSYVQSDAVPVPQNMGIRDLMSVEMTARGLAYD